MNDQLPTAHVAPLKHNSLSLSWFVPAIAIVIAAVLYLRWELNRGPIITIAFKDASGLTIESPIMYRGAIVGKVINLSLNKDQSRVVVSARLETTAANLAKVGSHWWIVRPSVSLQGVSGLGTIIGPRFIQLSPGEGELAISFEGSSIPFAPNGKQFTLISNSAENIAASAPIFYRGVDIGFITNIELAQNSTSVLFTFIIKEKYTSIVRTNSVFWNESGISVEAGLTGVTLHAGPLTSWIKGGVTMATPDEFSEIAPEEYSFTLQDDVDEDWLEWSPEIDQLQQTENP